MPRALSTVAINVLAQNPIFTVSATSTILNNVTVRAWDGYDDFLFIPENYYTKEEWGKQCTDAFLQKAVNTPYYIDKGRQWIYRHSLITKSFENCKFIVPIRDLRGCYHSANRINPKLFNNLVLPYIRPLTRLFKTLPKQDNIYLFYAEEFSVNPKKVLKEIYDFLGIEHFEHDLENIKTLVPDPTGDLTNGNEGIHEIHSKIIPINTDYESLIGKQNSDRLLDKYSEYYEVFYDKSL